MPGWCTGLAKTWHRVLVVVRCVFKVFVSFMSLLDPAEHLGKSRKTVFSSKTVWGIMCPTGISPIDLAISQPCQLHQTSQNFIRIISGIAKLRVPKKILVFVLVQLQMKAVWGVSNRWNHVKARYLTQRKNYRYCFKQKVLYCGTNTYSWRFSFYLLHISYWLSRKRPLHNEKCGVYHIWCSMLRWILLNNILYIH